MSVRSKWKRIKARLVLAGLILAIPIAAGAQGPTQSARERDLERRVRELEQKLEKLMAGQAAPATKTTTTTVVTPPPAPGLEEGDVKAIVQDEIKKQKPLAGWKDGFFLESPSGDFKMKLRGYVQADARWFPNTSGDDGTSSFFLRRVRPTVEGTVFKYFDYKIMPDFGGGSATIQDAYMDVRYFPEAMFRAGKYKEPFSIERLQSGADLIFVERSLSQNLAPNRDVGFMLHGALFEGILGYQLGVFNGVVDGGSVDGDFNSDKDFAGRIFVEPWRNSEIASLQGLGFGVAGTYGNQDNDPLDGTRVQTAGRATIYRINEDVIGEGIHSRLDPQLYYFWGPFGMMGEYIWSDQAGELTDEDDLTTKGRFTNEGGFIQASYVLTGENASYRGVVPINSFDPRQGRWGAFEVAARGSNVHLGRTAFNDGFATASNSISSATAYTLGLNWYFNKNFKVQLNYERTEFNRTIKVDNAQRSREDVLLTRFQISY